MKKLRKLIGGVVVAAVLAAGSDDILYGPPLGDDYCNKQAIYDVWGWYWSFVYIARGCGWPS